MIRDGGGRPIRSSAAPQDPPCSFIQMPLFYLLSLTGTADALRPNLIYMDRV